MQGLLKPVETYNNVFCHQVYPESWASATPMTDLALQAGQGRTYKWFSGEPVFPFGAGISYTNFSITNLQARTGTSTGTPRDGLVRCAAREGGTDNASCIVLLLGSGT